MRIVLGAEGRSTGHLGGYAAFMRALRLLASTLALAYTAADEVFTRGSRLGGPISLRVSGVHLSPSGSRIGSRLDDGIVAAGNVSTRKTSVRDHVDRPAIDRRSYFLVLIGGGSLVQALLAALILLYVNFPAGYNVAYGLSLDSVALFRTLWPYPTLSLPADTFRMLAIANILALWAVYGASWLWVHRHKPAVSRRSIAFVIVAFALLFNGVLALLMPPVLSLDIYNYALYGRMFGLHGLNPYVTAGGAVAGDPFLAFAGWQERGTVYGPAWTLISSGAAALASQSVLSAVLVFKCLEAFFSLANCVLVLLLARHFTAHAVGPLLLYAWNPLILIETAGSGHNEAAMVTFALLGLLLVVRGRLLTGLVVLVVSVLVKYATGLLLILVVARQLAEERAWRERAAKAGLMAIIVVLLVAGLYFPFWPGAERVGWLLVGSSPMLNSMQNVVGLALRAALEGLLAVLPFARDQATLDAYVVWGLNAVFGLLVLAFVRTVAHQGVGWLRVLELWGLATLTYVVLIYAGAFPWYLVSPIAIASTVSWTAVGRRLALWSCGIGMAMMLLYAMPITG